MCVCQCIIYIGYLHVCVCILFLVLGWVRALQRRRFSVSAINRICSVRSVFKLPLIDRSKTMCIYFCECFLKCDSVTKINKDVAKMLYQIRSIMNFGCNLSVGQIISKSLLVVILFESKCFTTWTSKSCSGESYEKILKQHDENQVQWIVSVVD